jgi:hypothetical protein
MRANAILARLFANTADERGGQARGANLPTGPAELFDQAAAANFTVRRQGGELGRGTPSFPSWHQLRENFLEKS